MAFRDFLRSLQGGRARLAVAGIPDGGERLGQYPSEVDTGDESRRDRLALRILAIVCCALVLLVIALVALLASILPLKEKEAFFVFPAPRGDQMLRIEPMRKGATGYELATQVYVREYIVNRTTILTQASTMRDRWYQGGYVQLRSSPEVYAAFTDEANELIRKLKGRSVVRETVLVGDPVRIGDGYYQQDFDLIDTEDGQETRRHWRALVTTAYRVTEKRWEDRYINPFGFTVTGWSVSARDVQPGNAQ